MTNFSDYINDVVRYINNLELAEAPKSVIGAGPARLTGDEEMAAYVDAGSLVSFTAGVKPEQKSDVMNSTLLAQLAANKKYNREINTREWYTEYREVLENIGWVVQEFSFVEMDTKGSSFSVQDVVVKVLGAIASGNQLAVAVALVDHRHGGTDGRVVLFEKETHSLHQGCFQIAAATSSNGVVVMKMGAFYFSTQEDVKNVLWWRFKSNNTRFYTGSQVINLDNDVYSRVRDLVINKLGDRAEAFVRNIEI